MTQRKLAGLILCVAVTGAGCDSQSSDPAGTDYIDALRLGGDTTDLTASNSSHGFSAPAANLTPGHLETHQQGDAVFDLAFVAAPSSEHPDLDGLGPAFNNTSCNKCHQEDGRGTPPGASDVMQKLGGNESLFLRISIEDTGTPVCTTRAQMSAANNWCAPVAVPGFGTQLFHRGVADLRPDSPYTGQADVYYQYTTHTVYYGDGTAITLRKPVYAIHTPYDAPAEDSSTVDPSSALLQATVKAGARIGPPVFGQGLLEAISEADILALADPDDSDGDGISGRANYVYDPVKAAAGDPAPVSLGRFGWKANNASVLVQSLGAFNGDMGITNSLFPTESTAGTPLYDDYAAAKGLTADPKEVSDTVATAVTLYTQTLHVPARRSVSNAEVRRGAALFAQASCTACHTPSFVTGPHAFTELSSQLIYPFSDMLLHDLGEGLADGRRDFLADGREWKTRPLWGIGLTKTVNPLAGFLHDGRALSLEEAILWHGGEAEVAKESFRTMTRSDRDALVSFLKSL